MLDFYLIADEETKPAYPEKIGLVFAGSMDDGTFERLKRKQVIDERFEYYTDFRWSRALTMQMRSNIMQRQLQADSDVQKLLLLLDLAGQHDSGLIAYAD
jgi:hypothetical protein